MQISSVSSAQLLRFVETQLHISVLQRTDFFFFFSILLSSKFVNPTDAESIFFFQLISHSAVVKALTQGHARRVGAPGAGSLCWAGQ